MPFEKHQKEHTGTDFATVHTDGNLYLSAELRRSYFPDATHVVFFTDRDDGLLALESATNDDEGDAYVLQDSTIGDATTVYAGTVIRDGLKRTPPEEKRRVDPDWRDGRLVVDLSWLDAL